MAMRDTAPPVSVLIAAYNEQSTIEQVIRKVAEQPFDSEIIVVDDGSRDGTRAIVEGMLDDGIPNLRLIAHERNRGKGAAVRTGIDNLARSVVVNPGRRPRVRPGRPAARARADHRGQGRRRLRHPPARAACRSAPTCSGTTPATASCRC